ncbi:MAG: glutamine--fructose-6-phosphate transaminase (isomerizing) [Candidatus Latescibacteria bacterium]|nr:glutamine--fructose-6-phosphate transaminase (isomerizing) [Candidatus Latescibacterota bacterium]NIM22183.1 glutamine--fructose-6-phosphate transaminase (isomerizing) [Candidatus Latescibacterota bacterium]NIM64733.1 glutamine--fructose-6-phosphate transaminase (isomerizing) [Candidatus Latescibacterota bacterium]NIO01243.1 glutamine--fructose-6-phosphate transaminase (isomerizing) [Candidatus Latescibacterota bacterium]NIO27628.1 glutamine--fructose-6-phosphate transaminase (isomerizing) [
MCGIVGYLGKNQALPILLESLKRLEYRGYDSAGIAVLQDGCIVVEKTEGKISTLEQRLSGKEVPGTVGLAHTRWATHGEPTTQNAHPHVDCKGSIAVIHNGIIENYRVLKKRLEESGHKFKTDTDTEIIAHLIEEFYDDSFEEAVQKAVAQLEGTYGLVILSKKDPNKLIGVRNGSPLVVGVADDEYLLASDVSAILKHTRQVVYLDDKEMVTVGPSGFSTMTTENVEIQKEIEEISWDLEMIEKGGYAHFMLKEIFEQPETIHNACRGRLIHESGYAKLGGLNMSERELREIKRIVIIACGTSWHAALIGEYMIEEYARLPVEVEYASEFRYRNPIIEPGTITLAISQSGETIDTLEAMREAKRKGSRVLGVCNVVGSTIARESDGGVYIHAGPEIGVASTKAFTSQVTALTLLAIMLGRMRVMGRSEGQEIIEALQKIPDQVQQILNHNEEIEKIAKAYCNDSNFLYLGRGAHFPVALEGALKLKEISYVHAEGYPAAEMKHGPIALIDKNMPVVVICPRDSAYSKIQGNIAEVKARKGRLIVIATEEDEEVAKVADHVITIPQTLDMLYPILTVIPLQLLAYHIAVLRGCNVDQPRNLAKSVTVE